MKRSLILAAILAIAFALFVVPVHLRPFNFPADDAYFYLQVASNIHQGHGSTFNRITPTNGYHPLWMPACVLAFLLSGGGKLAALHTVMVFQQLLVIAILFFAYKISAVFFQPHWFLSFSILATFFLTGVYGSEGHLNAVLVLATLYVSAPLLVRREEATGRSVAIGALAGLATLARLDNIFFVAVLFPVVVLAQLAANVHRLFTRDGVKACINLAVPYCCVVVPYLLYNLASFGNFAPISGALKTNFPSITWNWGALSLLGKLTTAYAVFTFGFCSFFRVRGRLILCILSTSAILHALYLVLFTDDMTQWSWYYVLGVLNAALSVAFQAGWLAESVRSVRVRRWLVSAAAVVAVVLTVTGVLRSWIRWHNPDAITGINPFRIPTKTSEERWPREFARWMDVNLPTGAKIMVWDYPGQLAYLSDRQILPADGLMADYEYNDEVLKKGIKGYLEEKGIEYWIGPIVRDGSVRGNRGCRVMASGGCHDVEVLSPLHQKSAGAFRVCEEDKLTTVRSAVTNVGAPSAALWRIR